jgi:hypothetical protein
MYVGGDPLRASRRLLCPRSAHRIAATAAGSLDPAANQDADGSSDGTPIPVIKL